MGTCYSISFSIKTEVNTFTLTHKLYTTARVLIGPGDNKQLNMNKKCRKFQPLAVKCQFVQFFYLFCRTRKLTNFKNSRSIHFDKKYSSVVKNRFLCVVAGNGKQKLDFCTANDGNSIIPLKNVTNREFFF